MRNKLPIAVALAVLGASVTAGTAGAGSGSLIGVGEGGVQINLPSGQNLQDLQLLPQCSNTADDDGDGLVDIGDPDCTGPLDATESGSGAPTTTTPTEPADEPAAPGTGGSQGGGGGGNGGGGETGGNGVGGGSVGTGGGSGGRGESGDTVVDADDEATSVPEEDRQPMEPTEERNGDGSPADTNPGLTVADFGPAPVGVPNFVIDQFSIPPFLLPIYQACGTEYGIPWQVLASINRIETAFGTNLNVSSAGALGWMQFIPSSWQMYGVDANDDGRKDPYNPVDAICAAARYLRAAGGQEDLRTAIFAYNHADWYVDEVLLYANQYGKLPADLVSSLTGLTEGARFPVAANARYADDISERQALKRSTPSKRASGNAADVISGSPTSRGIDIFAREGAPVVAVNDGVITDVGESKELGKYIVLRDAYGNRFTYANLGEVSEVYPVPKENELTAKDFELVTPDDSGKPTEPATVGGNPSAGLDDALAPEAEPKAGERRRRRQGRAQRRSRGRRRRGGGADQHRGRPRASLRLPGARQQHRSRRSHRPARRPDERRDARLRDLQGLLLRRPSLRPQVDGARAAEGGLEGDRRHRARQDRQGRRVRPARPLLDPAGRPRRAADRPEADPRRLEAARGDGDLPRPGQEPVHRRRVGRPGAADVQAAADRARARRPAARDLLLRPRGHPVRPDRPPDPGAARVPGRQGLPAHDHLAEVRPLGATRPPGTSPSTRPATRSTSPRSTASRCSATRARERSPRRWSRT